MENPDIWKNKDKTSEIGRELVFLKEEVSDFNAIRKELKDISDLEEISNEDEEMKKELDTKRINLENKIKEQETKTYLSEKYDRNNAIIGIYSGAGGVDAQDWATMLLRMYQRFCDIRGFKTKIIDQTFGEGGGPEGRIGTKSAFLEVKGNYAFGILKKESGVHRLVRQSPFSSKNLRHTSFVLVEVLPEISKKQKEEIKIPPDDLKIDTYRASGPGGQYVNKRESAIRITHIPTGIVVSSQSERLQGLNKEKAMDVLYSKISQLRQTEEEKELKKIKGESVSASWGNQIRSYVLHPYKMVKDLRTNVESHDPEEVLDGNLAPFIESEIKL